MVLTVRQVGAREGQPLAAGSTGGEQSPPVVVRTMKDQTYTIVQLRRPAGRWQVNLSEADNGGFKTRAHWLLEALGSKWTRRTGYHLAAGRVEIFKLLYDGGWSASWRLGAWDKKPYTFSLPGGPELLLKYAVRHERDRLAIASYDTQDHPSGLSGEHDCVLDAIHKECLHSA